MSKTSTPTALPKSAKEILDHYHLEMRWRCLSLAADLDRVQCREGGAELLRNDPRAIKLQKALAVLLEDVPNRAEKVQDIFSDKSPLV